MSSERSWVRLYPADWAAMSEGLGRIERSMLFDLAVYNWEMREGFDRADMEMMFGDVPDWESRLPAISSSLIDTDEGCWVRIVRAMMARTCDPWRMSSAAWRKVRDGIFERDGFRCTYCGDAGEPLECDHIIPVSKGGSHDHHNLTTACKPCNRSKRDLTVAEWRAL